MACCDQHVGLPCAAPKLTWHFQWHLLQQTRSGIRDKKQQQALMDIVPCRPLRKMASCRCSPCSGSQPHCLPHDTAGPSSSSAGAVSAAAAASGGRGVSSWPSAPAPAQQGTRSAGPHTLCPGRRGTCSSSQRASAAGQLDLMQRLLKKKLVVFPHHAKCQFGTTST
jgi:hypothetical protein